MRTGSAAQVLVALAISSPLLSGCGKAVAGAHGVLRPSVAKETASWPVLKTNDWCVTLKVPDGWLSADLNDPAFIKFWKGLGKSASRVERMATANSGKVLALGFRADSAKSTTDFIDNVNITKAQTHGKTSWTDSDISSSRTELEAQLPHIGPLDVDSVAIRAGRVLHYSGLMKIKGPDNKPFNASVVGYLALHGNWIYVVTYAAKPDDGASLAKLAAKSIQTLEFK